MRAIMVLFDTLNRRMLPPYGCDWVHAPNFERLARNAVTFDNCYGGSMPCMPARRELHTGRYNFLHRGWGQLEPFDDSVPEMLKHEGVYTHLATDHYHYWEDGGATYHGRFSTFEFFRGQESDPWKGHVGDPQPPENLNFNQFGQEAAKKLGRQNWINRIHQSEPADHSQTQVFDAGVEFIHTNQAEDRWFLQIETFDPHEPFFSYDDYKKLYPRNYTGPLFDWPIAKPVTEQPDVVEHLRSEYASLLTMCDASLGRVLDMMDEYSMWDDTMLVVCTDHGFLLGEHEWWGKSAQPWYDETIHTPLFVWDPRTGIHDERRKALVQTIDIGPTLLEFFNVERTTDMQGIPLVDTVLSDTQIHQGVLFGAFGGHVCVTDGRYVYMRASEDSSNQPLFEYTLMPTRMREHFPVTTLREMELSKPFSFTKGVSTLRVPGRAFQGANSAAYGSLLYDLENDPYQQNPLKDNNIEESMIALLVDLLHATDAPHEQFERLGLPLA